MILNVYKVKSSLAGCGPICETLDQAFEEIRGLVDADDSHSDIITIEFVKMDKEKFDTLPEHQGY